MLSDSASSGKDGIALVRKRFELVSKDEAKTYKLVLIDADLAGERDAISVIKLIRDLHQSSILFGEEDTPKICLCSVTQL